MANDVITLVMLPAFLLFPLVGATYIVRYRYKLKDKVLSEKYGAMTIGFNTESNRMFVFWTFDFLRRIILAVSLVFLREEHHYLFHVLCFGLTSMTLIVLVGFSHARNSTVDRRIDYFNEVRLMLILYHMLTYTAFVQDAESKFTIGYSCAFVILAGLVINMSLLLIVPIKSAKRKLKLRTAKKNQKT